MRTGTILWDFDGTLAERPFMWSQAFLRAMNEVSPGHGLTLGDIQPHLQKGFPWHTPQDSDEGNINPDRWWRRMKSVFSEAFLGLGQNLENAQLMSERVHQLAVSPAEYRVFDDVPDVLAHFKAKGWENKILSNHMPDLPAIVGQLPIAKLIDEVFTSALIGFSKPHPMIFEYARSRCVPERPIWMVGDNIEADVFGADCVGINAILVRNGSRPFHRFAKDLRGVQEFIY